IIRRQFCIDRVAVWLRLGGIGLRGRLAVCRLGIRFGPGVLLVALFVRRLAVGFLGRRFAHRGAVVEAEYDDNGVRLLGGENTLGSGRPVGGIAFGLIFDETRGGLVLADHAHIRLLGIGIFEAVSQPVCHGIAQHQNVALRHGVALLGRRRLRKILPLRRLTPRQLLLEWRKQIVAEPAAGTALRLPLRRATEVAEIEKLRRRRSDDPDQQRDRDGQRDQRTALGEHAQKGFRFRHALRLLYEGRFISIVTDLGRKRAAFTHTSRSSAAAVYDKRLIGRFVSSPWRDLRVPARMAKKLNHLSLPRRQRLRLRQGAPAYYILCYGT